MPVVERDRFAERLARPGVIGLVHAGRAVDLFAGRALASSGATLIDLDAGDLPGRATLDLVAAAGASAALAAARLAVTVDVPLLLLPEARIAPDLGVRLCGAPVTPYPVLTYRIGHMAKTAVAEVAVCSEGDGPVRLTMDACGRLVEEALSGDGVQLVSSLPLPGWSRPTPALDWRLAAVALAEGRRDRRARPRVRAVLSKDVTLRVTAPGGVGVVADGLETHHLGADDAVVLGPHDVRLRVVSLPGADLHARVAGQRAGLARFARRITTGR